MKKYGIFVALFMICVVFLTGCTEKFSSDDFKSAMSNLGLTANSFTSTHDGCVEAYEASSKYVTFKYYKFSNYNGSTACYSSERMNVGVNAPEEKDEVYISGGQKYMATVDGKYYEVVRRGAVVVTAVGRKDDKSSIVDALADMGLN